MFALVLIVGANLLKPSVAAASTHVVQSQWDLYYEIPGGDGVIVTSAYFNGAKVFAKATLPFVMVQYQHTSCCQDNFGSSVLKDGPTKTNVPGGFTVRATYCFGACEPYDASDNFAYKYVESYTFLNTGEWIAGLDIYGPGIETSATYEIFWRVDYDIDGPAGDQFDRYNSGGWQHITTEQEFADDEANAPDFTEWRQTDSSHKYKINPLSYPTPYSDLVVAYHSGEATGQDGREYPSELYDNNESVSSGDLVQWHHGIRSYVRPQGCGAGGAGCDTPYGVRFEGISVGY